MYIERKIHQVIKRHIERKEYTIITGPRQSGKTSLVKALFRELKDENRAVSYITFEDRDILKAIDKHPEEVFSYVKRPAKSMEDNQNDAEKQFLFIDEVQYAADPSHFLKYLVSL